MVVAVQHFDLWSLRLLGRVRSAPTSLRISTMVDLLVVIVVAVLSITLNIALAVFIIRKLSRFALQVFRKAS